ncbi:MAG: IS110 family transposase [Symploca sp. SIO2G7]|nr:IS110 family transposase [Symploca sp. SIO2G7]
MAIIGLDVGRGNAVVAALNEFPRNPKRYFSQHRRNFLRLQANQEGINTLLSFSPQGIVMEPTGMWYSAFWSACAAKNSIPIFWVGHADLSAQRHSYGFKNKRDDEDAFCLALTYFDDRFVDAHERKRFLTFEAGTIARIRELFFELKQLGKCRTLEINQLRQRLALEFPELQKQYFIRSKKLGFSPALGWLASQHNYSQIKNKYARSVAHQIGVSISGYTRAHASSICNTEMRITAAEKELTPLLQKQQFKAYIEVFREFGFGIRNQALLLNMIYPFDKFLIDARPWVEWEDINGKWQKRHRSLRSFQAYLGLSYTIRQSGEQKTKKFGGSDICRSQLYEWAVAVVCPEHAKLNTIVIQKLNAKFNELRKWDSDRNPGNDAIAGKDAIIRVLFMATRLLFQELCKKLTLR